MYLHVLDCINLKTENQLKQEFQLIWEILTIFIPGASRREVSGSKWTPR